MNEDYDEHVTGELVIDECCVRVRDLQDEEDKDERAEHLAGDYTKAGHCIMLSRHQWAYSHIIS